MLDSCPKCGSRKPLIVRYAVERIRPGGLSPDPCLRECPEGEHLHLRCRHCGYRTYQACLDAESS